MNEDTRFGRRFFLRASAVAGTGIALAALRSALAQGAQPPGIYRMDGEVRLNGVPARPGMRVAPGDTLETGARGEAVFVVGRDAFLVRAGTRLETSGRRAFIGVLRIVTGKVLSVFGPGGRRVETATATVGIRGTGIYVESEPERTYVCTCYGVADLQPRDAPRLRETVSTSHHEQPRYIYRGSSMPANRMMEKAPVVNHTDAELTLLESLVGRRPPFLDAGGTSSY